MQFTASFLILASLVAFVAAETHTITFTNNYLQTGGCGLNGDSCTAVETTLQNPTSPGAGSATDITLIPDHAFSVTSGFGYFDGCDGTGLDCTSASCPGAFTDPTNGDIVSCEADNVNLAITFCD
ncbi:hypothetical protein BT96DRAFT_920267 [Gymnopus androsaceus JB14]|uniref:Glycopeptide n=1 Tax=Gymnopus androsaceus JB14 TaxID=1447944 RepID=A0A6A4HNH1_9AGAR|nr:hypothetical protein BT96DRAFT_920267 [Gymnopus androsaceus JB14]